MDEVLQFFSDNKDALTAMGIILTFSVSIISLYYSVRNNKAVHYVNSVTKNRVEWIAVLRDNVARLLALLKTDELTTYNRYAIEIQEYDFDSKFEKIRELETRIILLLNYFDEIDNKMMSLIHSLIVDYEIVCIMCQGIATEEFEPKEYFEIPENVKELVKDLESTKEEVLKYFQIYLKAEWNRVKYESQGKTYEKETQIFDIWELEQKYDNPKYENNVWKRFCINSKAKVRRMRNSSGFFAFIFFVGIIILILAAPWLVKEIVNAFIK